MAASPDVCPVCERTDPRGAVLLWNFRFYHVDCWAQWLAEQRRSDAEPQPLPRATFRKPQPPPSAG